MIKKIIQLLAEAETENQIQEVFDAYGEVILYDNYLCNKLRDARVRVAKLVKWETYQLN
jgi:nicotinate-nucleotide pyrophosphorylase